VFGSELGALAAYPGMPQKLAPTAVEDFFTFGYVPEPETIFVGIFKMPAAHYGLIGPGETALRPVRYWTPPDKVTPCTLEEAVPQLQAHLARAVRERLVSDVPLGAFLSGGVDSSGIVAIAAGLRSTPLDTFTIGFDGGEDETPFARLVSQRYGTTQHTERAAAVDMIDAARSQARIFGEPFGDSSSVPSLSVSRLARRHATVAISGDGGDEVFGGYRRYRWHGLVSAARRFLPRPVRRGAVARLAALYPKLDNAPRFLRFKTTLTELSLDSAVGYASTMTKTETGKRHALFGPALRSAIAGHDPNAKLLAVMGEAEEADPLLTAQLADLATWLPGDILTKMDRTSMAASLESRAPLLDYEIFAWGLALPAGLKIHGGEGKYVLKKALEKYLPPEILYRPKQGFATYLAPFFRREIDRIRERLLGDIMVRHNLFDAAAIGRLLDEHAAENIDHTQTIWLLLCFEGFLYFLAGEPAA
jgi:asparagine synthase (glutamine-hydrolysing)